MARGPDWINGHIEKTAPVLGLDEVPKLSRGYAVAGYLLATRDGPLDLSRYPAAGVLRGGLLIWRENCRECHTIYREGGSKGPRLEHVAGRRETPWIVAHFKNPRAFVPTSKMPNFADLPEEELRDMARYLLALP